MTHHGNVTKINGAVVEPVDIITAGFPCQSVSVAGKREGLTFENGDYTRSGLVYEAFRIIKEMQEATDNEYPKYLVFENVPGLLSSNKGKDFESILNKIAELGFLADMDILDAQDFGVPQRRKRVYISCVNVEFLMKNGKMPLSESITLQLISELLLNGLGVRLRELEIAPQGLGVAVPLRSTDSLKRTMNTFSLTRESRLKQLQNTLERITARLESEQGHSELKVGNDQTENACLTQEAMPLWDLGTKTRPFTNTDMSLKECWGESLRQANECITLTATSEITQKKIYMYAKTLLNTLKYTIQHASLVLQTNPSCKNYYQWVESHLTEAREYINAVNKYNKKHKCVGRNDDVWDFNATLRETEILLERYFTIRCAAKIPPKPDRLFGNHAESGETRESVTADAVGGVDGSAGTECLGSAGFDASMGAKAGNIGYESEISPTLNAGKVMSTVFSFDSLSSNSMKSSNPVSGCRAVEVAKCIDTTYPDPSKNQGGMAIVMATQQGGAEIAENLCPTITAAAGMSGNNQPVIALQANGIDRADTAGCNGCGWRENESYTLNTVDRHAVCYSADCRNGALNRELSTTLQAKPNGGFSYNCISPVVYDARGNGDGETACTITGDHQNRITDYTAGAVYEPKSALEENWGEATAKNALRAGASKSSHAVVQSAKPPRKYIIRRLTPTECARLQGFPDTWGHLAPYDPADADFWEDVRKTHAEINGKKYKPCKNLKKWYDGLHTDSAEYKAYGNGLALPCAEFVIRGIAEVLRNEKGQFASKGGVIEHKGYTCIYKPEHPRAKANGYVREHILVAEEMLGRPLDGEEVVHHINGDKADNRPENLEIFPNHAEHVRHHNRTDGKKYSYNGGEFTVAELSEFSVVDYSVLTQRINKLGWDIKRAVETPKRGQPTLGSLFDGIGGFPLAGALNGIEPLWASEVEPYAIAVTKSRFAASAAERKEK